MRMPYACRGADLCVVFSANSIVSVRTFFTDARLFYFYRYHSLGIGLWCVRYLEIALLSHDEASRPSFRVPR